MQTSKPSRITFIILRYMRRPILILVCVYAVSMVGWILIPGVDAEGNPRTLSFFHAFYFLTYTVTTTGFGELPTTFTEAQRMWGIVSLYSGVIAWFYALGSIVGLVQNPDFRQSLAERGFAKRVAHITEPFYIICGFGNTGALLIRGLTDAGWTVVVVDQNPERVKTLMLREYHAEVAGLSADARIPDHLIEAGLLKPNCKAVLALTQDEAVNLKISVTARLLNPDAWIVTQSTSETHEDTLATLGPNVHIIDPFQTYAKYLGATISAPQLHTLNQWMAGTPEATLTDTLRPPEGTWILCGFGRMGRWIHETLEAQGITTVVIDPHPDVRDTFGENAIIGLANQKNLLAAGVEKAAGIVAGTDNDSDNLSIVLNAKALNPDIFSVVRQNRYRNQVVFKAANADFIMMPSLVSARRILFLLIAPMLKSFFEALRGAERETIDQMLTRLRASVGGTEPRLWTLQIEAEATGAVLRAIRNGTDVTLAHLLSDPTDRSKSLSCVPLVVGNKNGLCVMPNLSTTLGEGDDVLFCGDRRSYALLQANANNDYTLGYLITGRDQPRGWIMQWLRGKLDSQEAV